MNTELLVVGGGIAGYTAAIRGAQRGMDVTLVEADRIGGTCLNHGCIPSKALLSATETAHEMDTAEEMGIYVEPFVDYAEMVAYKDGIVDQLTGGVEQLCLHNDVSLVDGRAQFEDSTTVTVDRSDEIAFESAIIATGSRPLSVNGFDFDAGPILDARQALAIDRVPPRLLVVGAGYIGMELSTVFARLGTDVTIVEMLDSPLPQYEDELTRPVQDAARSLGITFNFGERATGWEPNAEGVTVNTESDTGRANGYETDRILVAIGRAPVTSGLNLDVLDVSTDERGFIETDEHGRTGSGHIFAVGDVTGEPLLAHAGVHEGIVAAETIAGNASIADPVIPKVVFTHPEIATVGMTEAEALEADIDPVIGRFPFTANGRALTRGQTDGFVRLVADQDGTILGGQIVGPEASELIAEIGLAVELDADLDELADTVHAHPTLSEATMEAAENGLGQAIHTSNR